MKEVSCTILAVTQRLAGGFVAPFGVQNFQQRKPRMLWIEYDSIQLGDLIMDGNHLMCTHVADN